MSKEDVKKGLIGIVVDETTISKVMPDINSLTYRGYPVQDLCENCRFEEVAYLVWHANLPNTLELKKFETEERESRAIGPLKRRTERPPMPGGVAEAIIVSFATIKTKRRSLLQREGGGEL